MIRMSDEQVKKFTDEIAEMEGTLKLIRESDARAIKMWQEAHPGNDHVWPDRGKMIFWLLDTMESYVKGFKDLRNETLEEAYLIARGGEDRFQKHGTKQLYWKGRSDAAAEIRAAKTK